jgi:hypothetical protein
LLITERRADARIAHHCEQPDHAFVYIYCWAVASKIEKSSEVYAVSEVGRYGNEPSQQLRFLDGAVANVEPCVGITTHFSERAWATAACTRDQELWTRIKLLTWCRSYGKREEP